MRKIVEYNICSSTDRFHLRDMINKEIKEGWQPHGSMVIQVTGRVRHNVRYLQPLIKYEEDEIEDKE